MAQAVDNDAVLYQAQVGVPPHRLKIQLFLARDAHLIVGEDIDADQPVAEHLLNAHHPAGQEMLAHQHGEYRGLQGAFIAFIGQVQPCAGGVGVDEQAVIVPARADQKHHHVLLRLLHLVHPPPG